MVKTGTAQTHSLGEIFDKSHGVNEETLLNIVNDYGEVDEQELDLIAQQAATIDIFAEKLDSMFEKYGITAKDITKIDRVTKNTDRTLAFLDNYMQIKDSMSLYNDPVNIGVRPFLELYAKLKGSDNRLEDFGLTLNHIAEETYSRNLYMVHALKVLEFLDNPFDIGPFLDFNHSLTGTGLTLDEQADMFYSSGKNVENLVAPNEITESEFPTPFDMEQERFKNVNVMQDGYRSDPWENSHHYEHFFENLMRFNE